MTAICAALLFVSFVAVAGVCTNQPASVEVWQWPTFRWTLLTEAANKPNKLLSVFGRRTDSDTKPISSDVIEPGKDITAAEKRRYWSRFKRQYAEPNVPETPPSTATTTSSKNPSLMNYLHSTTENAQRRPSQWVSQWQRNTLNATSTPSLHTQAKTNSLTTTTTTSTSTTIFVAATQMTSTLPSGDAIAASDDPITPGTYDEEKVRFDKFLSCLAACHTAIEKYAVKTVEQKSALPLERAREFVNCSSSCLLKFERRRQYGSSTDGGHWLSDLYDYLSQSTSIWILVFVVAAGFLWWQSDVVRIMRNWFENAASNSDVPASSEYTPIWSEYSNRAEEHGQAGDVNRAVNRAWTIVRYQVQRTIYFVGQLTVYVLSLSYIPDNIAQYVPWSDAAARIEAMGMQAFRGTVDDETRSALSDDDGTVSPSPDQDATYGPPMFQQSTGTNYSPNGRQRKVPLPGKRTESKVNFIPKRPSRGVYNGIASNEIELPSSNRQPYVALFEREGLSGVVDEPAEIGSADV